MDGIMLRMLLAARAITEKYKAQERQKQAETHANEVGNTSVAKRQDKADWGRHTDALIRSSTKENT